MATNVAPGTKINVKVVKTPTSKAAAKTITRLLSRDAAVKKENERLRRARQKNQTSHMRGGREWFVRVPKQRPVTGRIGESGTITATLDVLSDLKSVERFVEVKKA